MIRPPEGVRFRLRHLSYFGKEDAARAFLEAAAETGTYSALTVEEEGEEFMAILEETVEVSMHMMNARTDVLAELNCKIPETWTDLLGLLPFFLMRGLDQRIHDDLTRSVHDRDRQDLIVRVDARQLQVVVLLDGGFDASAEVAVAQNSYIDFH